MSDLRIPSGVLEELMHDMAATVSRFRASGSFAADIADLVGHPGLASKVRDFSSDWSDHRESMIDSVSGVEKTIEQIDTQFSQVDGQLASSLSKGDK